MTARRAATRALFFLTLGFATTLSFAWFCGALIVHAGKTTRLYWNTADEHEMRAAAISEGFGRTEVMWFHFDDIIGLRLQPESRSVPHADPPASAIPGWTRVPDWTSIGMLVQEAQGWPLRGLACERSESTAACPASPVVGGFALSVSRSGFRTRLLACRPIPLGLTADTGVFALAWCLILLGPRALLTQLRHRLGRCPRCGYDLSGNTTGTCPECGNRAASAGPAPTVRTGSKF